MNTENSSEENKDEALSQDAVMPCFDIYRDDLYEYGKPKDRTRSRLKEIAECGMEECGVAQFGYKGVVYGLYIEKVWSYSDEDFKDYMDWVKAMITERSKNEA